MRSRPRSYALTLAGALAGGVLGAAFDQVTVAVSPEYFVIGKGLPVGGFDLRIAAGWIGFRGGLALGALTVGTGLWIEARGVTLRWSRLLLGACASGLGTALVMSWLLWLVDPLDVRLESAGALHEHEASRYLLAWGAHIGVYVGVIAGVTGIATRARARSLACPSAGSRGSGRAPGGRHRRGTSFADGVATHPSSPETHGDPCGWTPSQRTNSPRPDRTAPDGAASPRCMVSMGQRQETRRR